MTVESLTQKFKVHKFGFGLVLGAICGFFIRDEFYYPTFRKVDDLVQSYKVKQMEITLRRNELAEELRLIVEQENSAQKK